MGVCREIEKNIYSSEKHSHNVKISYYRYLIEGEITLHLDSKYILFLQRMILMYCYRLNFQHA